MPPEHESRPEERHMDFAEVQRLLLAIKKGFAFLLGAMVLAVIPLMVAGVKAVIDNTHNQKELAGDFREWKQEMRERQEKQETFNGKTSIMWHQGQWKERAVK